MLSATDQYGMFYERSRLMTELRGYLISLCASALLCSLLTSIHGNSTSAGKLIKMMCGVYMCLTILAPLLGFSVHDLQIPSFQTSANAWISSGQEISKQALADSISSRVEAYILDKAEALGATISVEVSLDDSNIPAPSAVRIRGKISPCGKITLSQILTRDLGIAPEDQIWIS